MTQSTDFGTPSSMAALTNKVGVFDEYIAFKTGDYTSACLIGSIDEDNMTGTGKLVTVSRTGSAYGSTYQLTTVDVTNEPITIYNDYYCYSNIGIGQDYSIPHFNQLYTVGIFLLVGFYLFVSFISGGVKLWRRLRR